jgi:glycosyltransferase involved in cell wall biosynthesis
MREIHRLKPDVVWFNLLFSTFGRNPLVAFSGLTTPLLARVTGHYTHVTLHHLMDTVDLKDAGVRFASTYRLAGKFATRMLLLSNSVSVLMPGYRRLLNDKYGGDNVHVRSHGILTRRPEYPDFSRRGNPTHRILAFGKWGTYKRLELMIKAFEAISQAIPNAKLVIAGGDHPQAAGYVESVKRECEGNPRIEFTGYVDEDRLADLFQSASVAVMPYSSSTGCSGVAHLACAYGVPIVCADLPDFREMADGEELAIEFYRPGDAGDLGDCLIRFLENPEKQETMAESNFSAALRMTMPNVVQKYLRHFELQQRIEALRYVTKFRRLPNWVPRKSFLLRMVTRNSLGWVHRSAVPRPPLNHRERLLKRDHDTGVELGGIGTPVNGDAVRAGGNGSGMLREGRPAAARNGKQHGASNGENQEHAASSPQLWQLAHEREPRDPEGQEPGGIAESMASLGHISPSNGNGSNRESGSSGSGAGNNGRGRK